MNKKKSLGASVQTFPMPVYIVGTYDKKGVPNAMTVSGCGICCATPPSVMISIGENRYTYKNIKDTGVFTVGFPRVEQVKAADYLGIISGSKGNKFDNVNLTPVKSENINAPVIEEFPMTLECKFQSETKMGDHYMIIAEITNVLADENCLTSKGAPDIKKMNPLAFSPAEYDYYAVGEHVGDAFRSGRELMSK